MVMGLVLVGYAAWLLLRSEINPLQPTLPQLASKLHLPLLFVAGAAAAMWVLTVAGPQRWAAFNVAEAAGDFDEVAARRAGMRVGATQGRGITGVQLLGFWQGQGRGRLSRALCRKL